MAKRRQRSALALRQRRRIESAARTVRCGAPLDHQTITDLVKTVGHRLELALWALTWFAAEDVGLDYVEERRLVHRIDAVLAEQLIALRQDVLQVPGHAHRITGGGVSWITADRDEP
jgi:hypothetical protein